MLTLGIINVLIITYYVIINVRVTCEMDNLWAGRTEVTQWLRCSNQAKGRILIPCYEVREGSLLPAVR